jgi:hypothetical protein
VSAADRFTLIEDWRERSLPRAEGAERARRAEGEGRPVALDLVEGAAFVGVPARERARQLESLEAPDFALPDLAGRVHRLSEHRGKKVLLVVYASW